MLTVNGGAARLVLEMTDSARNVWSDYLDEAERNRNAAASLGLVREPVQNSGHTIRSLGSRRIVLAFDPATDDPQLLLTVVQLLRVAALSVSSRHDAGQLVTAEEKIGEALTMLAKISEIAKSASAIRKGALKIEGSCATVHDDIERLLGKARAALAGLGQESTAAADSCQDGTSAA